MKFKYGCLNCDGIFDIENDKLNGSEVVICPICHRPTDTKWLKYVLTPDYLSIMKNRPNGYFIRDTGVEVYGIFIRRHEPTVLLFGSAEECIKHLLEKRKNLGKSTDF